MKKGFDLIEFLIIVALVCLCAEAFLSGGCNSNSDGSRVGTVTKFSHKGMFRKSWEGEQVMGGMRTVHDSQTGAASVAANIFEFSVLDENLVPKIQALMDIGHRAKLTYHQVFLHNPLARDTSYCIVEAKDLEEP